MNKPQKDLSEKMQACGSCRGIGSKLGSSQDGEEGPGSKRAAPEGRKREYKHSGNAQREA